MGGESKMKSVRDWMNGCCCAGIRSLSSDEVEQMLRDFLGAVRRVG